MKFEISSNGSVVVYLNWSSPTLGHNESIRDFRFDIGEIAERKITIRDYIKTAYKGKVQ